MEVIFDVAEFQSLFPHLKDVEDSTLELYFAQAVDRYSNDDSSVWPYKPPKVNTRKYALYYYACHLATLSLWAQSGQTGRVSSASQGSVSTSFDLLKGGKPTQDWYLQTPCGATFYLQYLKPLIVGGRIYNFEKSHPWN